MHHQTLKEVMGRDWWSGGVPLDYEIGLSKIDVMWDMISLGKSRTLRNCRDWKGELFGSSFLIFKTQGSLEPFLCRNS